MIFSDFYIKTIIMLDLKKTTPLLKNELKILILKSHKIINLHVSGKKIFLEFNIMY